MPVQAAGVDLVVVVVVAVRAARVATVAVPDGTAADPQPRAVAAVARAAEALWVPIRPRRRGVAQVLGSVTPR